MVFENKTILITGGTGSLGKTLVRRIMTGERGEPKKIIVFSRDEDKQYRMKLEWKNMTVATDEVFYHNYEEILDFRIGDVKDYESVLGAVSHAEMIIHAAAMKQVPVCEYFPFESIKTNVLGVENIIQAISRNESKVETLLTVSTDKACKPINTYGMCKALQERLTIEANQRCPGTRSICVRYGNVAASRGSVIPLFKEQIRNGGPVTITTGDMTRFMMTLDTAVDTIFDAFDTASSGDTYVPNVSSSNIVDLAREMIGQRNIGIEYVGVRPGEKIHEILVSEEEVGRTIKRDQYYVICPILPEIRKDTIDQPALDTELSSSNQIMSKDDLHQ
ncbi:MAG: polysaccharide biosynthesis protein, partial [Chloroflexota bacterium]|nr:polysaccharide biosynthesis protein [Chloroflexota bacterium]